MDRFSPFMGFCQKFKFQEGVHMCLVARKKELEKKKLENKFKSRAAYLKACPSTLDWIQVYQKERPTLLVLQPNDV